MNVERGVVRWEKRCCIRFNPITQALETYEGKINGIMIFFLAPFADAKRHDLSAYCLRNIQPKT